MVEEQEGQADLGPHNVIGGSAFRTWSRMRAASSFQVCSRINGSRKITTLRKLPTRVPKIKTNKLKTAGY